MALIERRRRLKLFCVLWGIFLAILALQPDGLVEIFLPFSYLRDIAHAVTYGILAFFLCLYLRFRRYVFKVPMTFWNAAFLALIGTAVWGGLTELIQHFAPDRYVSWKDWAYDMIGAFFGIVAFAAREKKYG
jgi:VanZ family protein